MNKGLLLGAGFSYDLGMPLAGELTEVFLGIFSKEGAKKFGDMLSKNSPFGEDRPINKRAIFEGIDLLLDYQGVNYEEVLSNLQQLGKAPGKSQSDKDSYHFLFSILYDILYHILDLYQKLSYVAIYKNNSRWFSNLKNLLSEKETWVFTLNHDLYMECLAIDFGIPITYGDQNSVDFPVSNLQMDSRVYFTYSNRSELNYFQPGFFKNEYGINLVKVHGGLGELEYNDGETICNQSLSCSNSDELMQDFKKIGDMAYFHEGVRIPSGKDRAITNSDGELDLICKSILTGGSKYSLTTNPKKGEEKLKLFDDALKNIEELTIIGYGFGDRHINYRLSNAMVINTDLKLRIVDPVNKPIVEFLQQFDYGDRIRRAQCGAPHWIEYCATEIWNRDQIDSLKNSEAIREIIKKQVMLAFNLK